MRSVALTPSSSAASPVPSSTLPSAASMARRRLSATGSSSRAKSATAYCARILGLPLAAPPRILGIRQRAQIAVAQGGILGDQGSDIGRLERDGFVVGAVRLVHRLRTYAACASLLPLMVSRPSRTETATVSPSLMVPESSMVASGFCSSRWITRLSGRAP